MLDFSLRKRKEANPVHKWLNPCLPPCLSPTGLRSVFSIKIDLTHLTQISWGFLLRLLCKRHLFSQKFKTGDSVNLIEKTDLSVKSVGKNLLILICFETLILKSVTNVRKPKKMANMSWSPRLMPKMNFCLKIQTLSGRSPLWSLLHEKILTKKAGVKWNYT